VLTLAAASRLLEESASAEGLTALAHVCGFREPPATLDADARRALGLTGDVAGARVHEGRGVLRAMSLRFRRGQLTRDAIAAATVRLQQRSPFSLWLVIAAEPGGQAVAIASAGGASRLKAALLLAQTAHVLDSDAETLRALSAAADGPELLVHARWCEILGREALTQRFFRALESTVSEMEASLPRSVSPPDARTLAILVSTRLLFLSFLEAQGWLNEDHEFLRRSWNDCTGAHGRYHRAVLLPLFFGTLNTTAKNRAPAARAFGRIPYLNGGLFTRTPLERRNRHALFTDETLGRFVVGLLGNWRFTVREHDATQAEAAVDPEMLGRAFECLMASSERRASGSFYTPRELVERTFEAALDRVFCSPDDAAVLAALRADRAIPRADAERFGARLGSLRVLDPACGSGAFLVHALETIATLRSRCERAADAGALRRDILARQIFGVDREPTAVWLCELRLWLAVVVETHVTDPAAVRPLPNLDAQVRVGDALAGDGFAGASSRRCVSDLARVRERYARASGGRKRTLGRTLQARERTAALGAIDARIGRTSVQRRDLVASLRGRDLFGERITPAPRARDRLNELRISARSLRAERRALLRGGAVPFDFAAQFADVGAAGGFDLIIGNPPWVRLHRIPQAQRSSLRSQFHSYRDAGWAAGAELAGAAAGFAAQVDLAALFVERSVLLARDGGVAGLLVPAKLWRSLAGGGIRAFLRRHTRIAELEDWSEAQPTFDAAVYPSLVVAQRAAPTPGADVAMAEHHRNRALRWTVSSHALPIDDSPGAPWLWLPPDPRAGFDRIRERGVPLGANAALRPRLGVKCGCNDAFILGATETDAVEPHMVRPLLRGEAVTVWTVAAPRERIIFPHTRDLALLRELPPRTRAHLGRFRARLTARTDLRGRAQWWTLFRVDAADTRRPRVVWADLARAPRAAVLAAGDETVPLNTCYVVSAGSLDEACALAVWINSPLAAAWLAALAEPARGGYRRLLGWTMALLPLPRDWPNAISALAPLGARAIHNGPPSSEELLDATLAAIGIAHRDVEALLTWGHR